MKSGTLATPTRNPKYSVGSSHFFTGGVYALTHYDSMFNLSQDS
jgi:hypothetical protein